MPILFQSRTIRHLLGMYITKQAEQERCLIAQHPLGLFSKAYSGIASSLLCVWVVLDLNNTVLEV